MADLAPRSRSVPLLLVVDDSHDYANSLCELLELTTVWRVTAAYSVRHAIEAVEQFAPDAVLLDLEMPPSSGLHVVDALGRQLAGPLPAIYVVSGNADLLEGASADPRVRGAAIKPADPAVLVRWLEEASSGK